MELRSPARLGNDAEPDGRTSHNEAEVARLRAEVAWLRAERAILWWAAGHDELTGLPNRRLFTTLAESLLKAAVRPVVVAVLDLNGFKEINDVFGHAAGDGVLRTVARRLQECVGDHVVARLGGDEFAALLTGPHPAPAGWWWRRSIVRLSTMLAEPMPVAGRALTVTASIGVAQVSDRVPDKVGGPVGASVRVDELLHRADLAMYRAKSAGRSIALCCAEPTDDRVALLRQHQPSHPHPVQVADRSTPVFG